MKLRPWVVMFAFGWLTASTAHAAEHDPAAAQALFDQGRALMNDKKYAEACPKLEESQRLDPGMGTLFHLADCYERWGKLASAWAAFLDVASLAAAAGQTDRENAAKARAQNLEPRLPRITITVPEMSRLPELRVTRDDVDVGSAQWGSPLPVDPGPHRVVASAPGRRAFTNDVVLKEGATENLTIPALEAARETAAPAPPLAQPAVTSPPPRAPEHNVEPAHDQGSSGGPGPIVIGLGALGVVGIGAGTVLGLMAKSKFDDSKEHCNPDNENVCTAQGVELRDDAFTLGNLSTVGFIVGGVALAGAGVVWLVQSGSSKETASTGRSFRAGVSPNFGRPTLVMQGSF